MKKEGNMSGKIINRRGFLRFCACVTAGSLLAGCGQDKSTPILASPIPPTPLPTAASTPGGQPNTAQIERIDVLAEGLDFPEGAAFDPQGVLWCTELNAGNLIRWEGGQFKRIPTQGKPNGLGFDSQSRAWVCDSGQNALRRYDPGTDKWETMVATIDGKPLGAPNDLAFDPVGNLLFTCPTSWDNPVGYVCCLKPDGSLSKIVENLFFPNGLEFMDEGRTLVVGETRKNRLWRGTWDSAACQWKDAKAWTEVGKDGPDGMLTGADGRLYAAVYGSGYIKVVEASGDIARLIKLPGLNPTNVAIDPSGKLGLVVTETEHGQLLSIPGIATRQVIFDGGQAWP
jgi:gluconolactonase